MPDFAARWALLRMSLIFRRRLPTPVFPKTIPPTPSINTHFGFFHLSPIGIKALTSPLLQELQTIRNHSEWTLVWNACIGCINRRQDDGFYFLSKGQCGYKWKRNHQLQKKKRKKEKQENIEGLLKLSLRCCRPSITGILASFATSGFFLPLFLLLPRRPASFSASPFGASPPPMRRQISSHTPGIFTVAASRLDSVAIPGVVAIRR